MKRGGFPLRYLMHFAKHFGTAGLIKLRLHPGLANRFENANGAQARHVAGVLRNIETDPDMTLRRQVVNLVRLNSVKQFDKVR